MFKDLLMPWEERHYFARDDGVYCIVCFRGILCFSVVNDSTELAQYGESVDNTVEQNSSVFSVIRMH